MGRIRPGDGGVAGSEKGAAMRLTHAALLVIVPTILVIALGDAVVTPAVTAARARSHSIFLRCDGMTAAGHGDTR